MEKHTPTPWKIETLKHGKSQITGEQYWDHILQPLNALIRVGTEEKCPDAEFLECAVNNFQPMRNALKEVLRLCQQHDTAPESPNYGYYKEVNPYELHRVVFWAYVDGNGKCV